MRALLSIIFLLFLSCAVSAFQVQTTWDAPEQSDGVVVGYNFYRYRPDKRVQYSKINTSLVISTSFRIMNARRGHFYVVRAVYAGNIESGDSNILIIL